MYWGNVRLQAPLFARNWPSRQQRLSVN